jgi:hypothetical protein
MKTKLVSPKVQLAQNTWPIVFIACLLLSMGCSHQAAAKSNTAEMPESFLAADAGNPQRVLEELVLLSAEKVQIRSDVRPNECSI